MKLTQLLEETEALTYINSLKITLTEIKKEVNALIEMRAYEDQACERIKKLVRKGDSQYRVIARMAQNNPSYATNVTLEEDPVDPEMTKLMEEANEH